MEIKWDGIIDLGDKVNRQKKTDRLTIVNNQFSSVIFGIFSCGGF